MNPTKSGILLVNLGSPDSTEVHDVRRYLDEFLMDERVIDSPYWQRLLLVKGIILNTRPKKSAEAYHRIWWEEGSPLVVISRRLRDQVAALVDVPVALGMRYGKPSIEAGLRELLAADAEIGEVFVVPLYPHYAMSSYETVVEKAVEVAKAKFPGLRLKFQPVFYDDPEYIDVLAGSMDPYIGDDIDHVLFSYHGIPERQIRKAGISGTQAETQWTGGTDADYDARFNYRHHVYRTTELVAEKLGLPADRYSVSFQSRLQSRIGKDPWMRPYTDVTLTELPGKGVRNLAVVCPAFVSDCLETLEEIGMVGRDSFIASGGRRFQLIPCMNNNPAWAQVLATWCERALMREAQAV